MGFNEQGQKVLRFFENPVEKVGLGRIASSGRIIRERITGASIGYTRVIRGWRIC